VILIDTGYLFPETYRFADELTERLKLNLQGVPPAGQPRLDGSAPRPPVGTGLVGIEQYNRLRKVEPMQRALANSAWAPGSPACAAASPPAARTSIGPAAARRPLEGHPIADWTDRDVWQYMKQHDLPYHPLWEQGYVSIGDVHTTPPLGARHACVSLISNDSERDKPPVFRSR
jgi:phosphoadenosine phosphosulfate reductase